MITVRRSASFGSVSTRARRRSRRRAPPSRAGALANQARNSPKNWATTWANPDHFITISHWPAGNVTPHQVQHSRIRRDPIAARVTHLDADRTGRRWPTWPVHPGRPGQRAAGTHRLCGQRASRSLTGVDGHVTGLGPLVVGRCTGGSVRPIGGRGRKHRRQCGAAVPVGMSI